MNKYTRNFASSFINMLLIFSIGNTGFSQTHSIGQKFEGGIIFYIDSTGQHGLIAAPFDQRASAPLVSSMEWRIPGSYGIDVGTGYQNTVNIIKYCMFLGGTAPYVCASLTLNGYDDWFLPSIDELDLMYLYKNKIGGFASSYYWSSTVSGYYRGWGQHFFDGTVRLVHPNAGLRVRAIRAF